MKMAHAQTSCWQSVSAAIGYQLHVHPRATKILPLSEVKNVHCLSKTIKWTQCHKLHPIPFESNWQGHWATGAIAPSII
jgi:hypothetical protein